VKGDDVSAVRAARAALEKVSHALAEQLYKQQASGSRPQTSGPQNEVKDGEVVDA
jgi:hypothetical protein